MSVGVYTLLLESQSDQGDTLIEDIREAKDRHVSPKEFTPQPFYLYIISNKTELMSVGTVERQTNMFLLSFIFFCFYCISLKCV